MRTETDLQMDVPQSVPDFFPDGAAKQTGKQADYSLALNRSLRRFFLNVLWVSLRNPAQAFSFFNVVRRQIKSARVRADWRNKGVHVPPIVLYSITNRCNLHCKGCYNNALRLFPGNELSDAEMGRVIREAKELGVSFMVLAGGEPLVRTELMNTIRENPEIIFFIFTNGTMIDEKMVAQFKKMRNAVPIISIEGFQRETDDRRGDGVYGRIRDTILLLRKNGIFFGTSITMTGSNYAMVTRDSFVKILIENGCKLFLYVEYTPVKEGTEEWVITQEQRERVPVIMSSLRARNNGLFVAVPGDEEQFGGCLAGGKGFVHISAEGNVEPCPFSPYSDSNLRKMPLRQALQSEFLRAIRERGDLEEGPGGCALWEKRDWVKSLLNHEAILEKKTLEPEQVGCC